MQNALPTARAHAAASSGSLPLLVGVALICVAAVRLADTLPGAWSRNDFAHYYLTARVMVEGENPYTTSLAPYCERLGFELDPRIGAATNPPSLMLVLSGVAWLPPRIAYSVWTTLQFACLAGLMGVLARRACSGPLLRWRWAAIGLALNATTVLSHFHYSQVQLLVAMLIATGYFDLRDGRPNRAIAWATCAAGLKLFPTVLLPWFALSGAKDARDVGRRALTSAGVGVLILLLSGPGLWASFATDGLANIRNCVLGSTSNYSLQSAAIIVTGGAVGRPLPDATLAQVESLSRLAAAAVVVAALLAVWLRRLPPRRAIGVLTIGMIVASPVCWSHYLVLLILPAWLLWEELSDRRWTAGSTAAACLTLLCLYPELDAPVPLGEVGLARSLLHFYPLFAMFALAGVLAFWRVPESRRQPGST